MREILFRGQTRRYGEKVWMSGEKVPSNWVYGGICQGNGSFSIIYGDYSPELDAPTEKFIIYTDTIGQYTGLKDKNGKKIFEGDCINHPCNVVEYLNGEFCVAGDRPLSLMAKHGEVIGNIHDNPELMEGKSHENI